MTLSKAPAHIRELADSLADWRHKLDIAKETTRRLQEQHDVVEADLFTALEDQGISSFRTERGLFMLNDQAWAKVEDEEQARDWADKNMPELLTLNRSRLSVVIRKIIKGEEDAPGVTPGQTPPGVTFYTLRKINWRRS